MAFFLGACSKQVTTNTSTAGAMISNSAIAGPKLLDRRRIEVSGFNILTEFIRPDVRARLDQEPAGDTEIGYVAQGFTEREYEAPSADGQEGYNEENPDKDLEIEKVKFSWAKKKFGDALAADPTAAGAIVLYADENYYEIGRLMYFIEEGRNRIAENSTIDTSRMQVIFGGYRGVPQVEFWVVAEGQNMPEFKPDERDDPRDAEN